MRESAAWCKSPVLNTFATEGFFVLLVSPTALAQSAKRRLHRTGDKPHIEKILGDMSHQEQMGTEGIKGEHNR